MEANKLPYAPIRKPEELFDDEHLLATGGLADITLPDGERAGQTSKATLFPFTMDGQRLGVRLSPPKLGAHTDELLQRAGPGCGCGAGAAPGRCRGLNGQTDKGMACSARLACSAAPSGSTSSLKS